MNIHEHKLTDIDSESDIDNNIETDTNTNTVAKKDMDMDIIWTSTALTDNLQKNKSIECA